MINDDQTKQQFVHNEMSRTHLEFMRKIDIFFFFSFLGFFAKESLRKLFEVLAVRGDFFFFFF